jgi:uncharacterized protein YsxB (DUF464 family)
MISITVFIKNNRYTGICSKGHAGYADIGEDIVCAAVSVLMINTLNAIETFTDDTFDGKQEDGYLEFFFSEIISEDTQLLMRTLMLGIQSIQKQYGNKYIKIVTKEV